MVLVQAPRAEHDGVGPLDGLDDRGRRDRAFGLDPDPPNRDPGLAHGGLAARDRPVGVVEDEREALGRGRLDAALDAQEPRRLLDALAEAAGHVCQGRDDDVADGVVAEFHAALEPVLEDLGEPTPLRERDHAPADVPGRCDPSSWRSRPLDPPSSATVTTPQTPSPLVCRSPLSRRGRPPPNATTRGAFATVSSLLARVWPMSSGLPVFGRPLGRRIRSTSRNCHEAKSVGVRADA
jgi:hypothetical protein